MDVHYERGSAWTEHHRSIWTDSKTAELRELWNTGLSTRDIADQLGGEFTRSAVIGKAHRLELERHKAPVPGRPKRIKPIPHHQALRRRLHGLCQCCRRRHRYRRSHRHRRLCGRCNWSSLRATTAVFPSMILIFLRFLFLRI